VNRLKKQLSILEEIETHTKGKFVYLKNYMEPIKSKGYGHLDNQSIYIEEGTEGEYKIILKKEVIAVKKDELLKELENYKVKFKIKNVFNSSTEKQYDNILKLAASTINPYYTLGTKEKIKKIEELFLQSGKFNNIEEVDLFLVGLNRVNKIISFNQYGRLDISYFTTRKNHYFLLDINKEEIFFAESTIEIENYIFKNLNIYTKEYEGKK
jgi:hypothetical protein